MYLSLNLAYGIESSLMVWVGGVLNGCLFFGYIAAFWPSSQALHDQLSKTAVYRKGDLQAAALPISS